MFVLREKLREELWEELENENRIKPITYALQGGMSTENIIKMFDNTPEELNKVSSELKR